MKANRIRRFLLSSVFWFPITVAVTVLVIFWEPLFSGLFIWGPDSSSFGHIQLHYSLPASYLGWWDNLRGLGTGGFTQPMLPHHLITSLAPPLSIKPALCIGSALGTILAAIYWFRGCGVKGWPVYLASVALGLTAHTFSLISAGHDGKTLSWPFCILLLAAVYRALTRRSLFHFVLAGYATGVAFALQPDIALLFSFLAFAYGLFLFLRHWPRKPDQAMGSRAPKSEASGSPVRGRPVATGFLNPRIQYVGHNVLGVLLAGILLFCVSLSSVIFALTVVLPHRQSLASVAGTTGDTKENEWEFATNWSLPPEEILEFVAPCVFGIQTGDSRGPYWGRLGRTLGWEQHHRGLMNLRQHTVYLGVIQLVFAIYAVVWAVRRRCGNTVIGYRLSVVGESEQQSGTTNRERITDNREPITDSVRRADIFFWGGVLLVSVMLALGRYFPLYRLFYMFPYAASLRAPVKFLHLAEISICILLAFGLEAFWASIVALKEPVSGFERTKNKKIPHRPSTEIRRLPDDKRVWRFFGFGCVGVGLLFVLSLAIVSTQEDSLFAIWRSMGMTNYSQMLLDLMRGSLIHAAMLFFVCAAVFLVPAYVSSPLSVRVMPVALLLVLAVDLGSVDKRYITVWDEYTRFTPRDVISRLEGDKVAYRVALPVRGGIYDIWRQYIFARNWITLLDTDDFGSLSAEDRVFYETLSRDPVRLWQLTSTKNILGPAGSLAPLTNSPAVEVAAFFNVMRDGSVQWTALGQGQHVWLRLKTVLPRAAMYPAEYVEGISWTNRLADPTWNPAQSVIVTGASAGRQGEQGRCEPAEIVTYKPNRVEVATRSGSGGILMLNDRFDPNWEVFLDGKAAPLLRCNGVMRGVAVPPGEHRAVFLYRPAWPYFAANMAGTVVLLVWGAARLWSLRRARSVMAEGNARD